MKTYTLKTNIKSRQNGEDVLITELPVPDIVTVGMMRKATKDVPTGNNLLLAHAIAESFGELGVMEGAALLTPDAIGYSESLSGLFEPRDVAGFDIPAIRPVSALVKKITVDIDKPIEFAAQVLEHSGMARDVINALDIRDFTPAVEKILGVFIDPKR